MSIRTLNSIRWLGGLLLTGLTVAGVALAHSARTAVFDGALGLIFVGVLPFLYSLAALERYKSIFDHEPTTLWGRTSNGKEARSALMAINAAGLCCLVTGAGLLVYMLFW
jgi:hypothetical protein